MPAQLVGQIAAGFAAKRARQSLRDERLAFKDSYTLFFLEGTLSVHVPRTSMRRMRIARNHAKFDARTGRKSGNACIAEFPL